jgi:geranylgeranyl pyrophosphate synthase
VNAAVHGLPSDLFSPIEEDLAKVEDRLAQLSGLQDATLRSVLQRVLLTPGKRLRPALTVACCRLFRDGGAPLYAMAAAVECLHSASLVHDDVMDQPDERRGVPALYRTEGNSLALLVGDYLFAQAAGIAAETNNLRVMRLFADCVTQVCAGQMEEHSRNRLSRASLTREDYFRTIDAKTAALFVLACQSGAILGEATLPGTSALQRYGRAVGLAFQIVDDVLDLIGDEAVMGKPAGSDLRQGVMTLPVIYLRDELPEGVLRAAFSRDGAREQAIQEITERARASRAIDRSYEEAHQLAMAGVQQLEELPSSRYRDLLADLAESVVQRVG